MAVLGNAAAGSKRRLVDRLATAIIECEHLEREILETVDAERRQVQARGNPNSVRTKRIIDAIDKSSELGRRLGLDWSYETGDEVVPVKRGFQTLDSRKYPLLSSSAILAHLAAMAPVYERWDQEE